MNSLGIPFSGRRSRCAVGLAVGAAAALLAAGPVPKASAEPLTGVVETTSGPVRGMVTEGAQAFQGIRYAASPAGAKRWTAPQPAPRSQAVIEATAPGAACPQPSGQFSASQPSSEDCLFLNVWTPASTGPFDRLPVFIWIHGGSLVSGAGASYDPAVMVAQNNIIVVTINYRLGALGWLAEAGLADAKGNSGNYGLMDQQFAMKWVRDNIARFGGDPLRVTIGGESAGGLSTMSNLASPTAQGFFHGAIIESGAYMLFDVPTRATQEAAGATFATNAGCSGAPAEVAACLRALPVETILATTPFSAQPTSGVPTLPRGLTQAITSGEFNRVPVMNGTNLNEGRLFEPLFFFDPNFTFVPGGPLNALIAKGTTTYPAAVALDVGSADASAVAGLYPPADFPNPDNHNAPSADEAFGQIFTDTVYTCNAFSADEQLMRFVPVYAYEFADPDAPNVFLPLIGFPYGASHASELQYLFDPTVLQGPADAAANAKSPAPGASVQPPRLTRGQQALAAEMKAYWANFVKFGTPNPGIAFERASASDSLVQLAFWPPFNGTTAIQSLVPSPAHTSPIFNYPAEHKCASLTALGLAHP